MPNHIEKVKRVLDAGSKRKKWIGINWDESKKNCSREKEASEYVEELRNRLRIKRRAELLNDFGVIELFEQIKKEVLVGEVAYVNIRPGYNVSLGWGSNRRVSVFFGDPNFFNENRLFVNYSQYPDKERDRIDAVRVNRRNLSKLVGKAILKAEEMRMVDI